MIEKDLIERNNTPPHCTINDNAQSHCDSNTNSSLNDKAIQENWQSQETRDKQNNSQKKFNKKQYQHTKTKKPKRKPKRWNSDSTVNEASSLRVGYLPVLPWLSDKEILAEKANENSGNQAPLLLNTFFSMTLTQLISQTKVLGINQDTIYGKEPFYHKIMETCFELKRALYVKGVFEPLQDGYGVITYAEYNYRIKSLSTFVHESLVKRYALKRGHVIFAQIHPPTEGSTCPFVLSIKEILNRNPEDIINIDPFEELTPYYPLERILLENNPDVSWDNVSMRVFDLLTPIGLGQRALIVAPPRTGKTVLLQCIANTIAVNKPNVHLIVLLVDERPEEVTDFVRQVKGEVISSTFDESAESHVHAAEMVLEKSRRMVEVGEDVVILLDSITRLARAYNTLMPSSGKILSGGIETSALQKPKRFFGSARNIENGGSLTIIATALIETGSRMDEVIFEEFKGTGNMELHLDRALTDKRIFPAVNLEKSGTRKEELLYHPQEMEKVYSLRRAMKGIPSTEAMEMLITRIKKTKTNAEFLMGLNR
jgi:transcription termination factor Rho